MTEGKGAESLQKAERLLELGYCRALELADFKGGFLARTAHELRSPLNKIISLQQMIVEDLCDDAAEEREFVTEAYAASIKLLEYLDFMIRVSKIEMGRLRPKMEPVALATVLQQVQENNTLQVTDRGLRLTVDLPPETVVVQTDPTWLQNVLTTLIDISLTHCDRGVIHLHCAPASPTGQCHLWLDDDRDQPVWAAPVDLPPIPEFDLEDSLSADLRMTMVAAMVQAMDGEWTAVEPAADCTYRLQLSLPTA